MIFMNKYVSKALEVVKENAGWVPKIIGGAVCVGGIAADHMNGTYNPAPWISTGSYLWAFGDAIEGWKIYATENLDHWGTRIKLVGSALRVSGAVVLGFTAGAIGQVPEYNALDLIPPISVCGGANAAGIGIEKVGDIVNEHLYPRYQAAAKLREAAEKLEKSKDMDSFPDHVDAYNKTAEGLLRSLDSY